MVSTNTARKTYWIRLAAVIGLVFLTTSYVWTKVELDDVARRQEMVQSQQLALAEALFC